MSEPAPQGRRPTRRQQALADLEADAPPNVSMAALAVKAGYTPSSARHPAKLQELSGATTARQITANRRRSARELFGVAAERLSERLQNPDASEPFVVAAYQATAKVSAEIGDDDSALPPDALRKHRDRLRRALRRAYRAGFRAGLDAVPEPLPEP